MARASRRSAGRRRRDRPRSCRRSRRSAPAAPRLLDLPLSAASRNGASLSTRRPRFSASGRMSDSAIGSLGWNSRSGEAMRRLAGVAARGARRTACRPALLPAARYRPRPGSRRKLLAIGRGKPAAPFAGGGAALGLAALFLRARCAAGRSTRSRHRPARCSSASRSGVGASGVRELQRVERLRPAPARSLPEPVIEVDLAVPGLLQDAG